MSTHNMPLNYLIEQLEQDIKQIVLLGFNPSPNQFWQLFDPQGKLITEQKGCASPWLKLKCTIMACGEPSFIHVDFGNMDGSDLSKGRLASY